MKFFDVTRGLSDGMLVYPGDITPSFVQEDAGKYLISTIHMSSHTGTHIDAPTHYLKTGNTVDKIPFEDLIGPCRVLDLSDREGILSEDCFRGRVNSDLHILIRTSFSGKTQFTENYPSIGLDAAEYLVRAGVRCVGIDSPSIESFNCDGSVHRHLLRNNCIIIELLDLSGVPEGDYDMIALPLRLSGLDGAPARVILTKK